MEKKKKYIFQEAKPEDCDDLRMLYKKLDTTYEVIVLRERIEELLADKSNFLFVVKVQDKVVATIFLAICLNGAFSDSKFAIIENIIVLEEYRKRGIGRLMLQEVEKISKQEGCTKIMVVSGVQRTNAHKLLTSEGFDDQICKAFKKYI